MDEPTSALSEQEVERLFTVVRRLREEGLGVIFISHRLGEVRELTDRVTVLRDGEVVLSHATTNLSSDELAEAMVGRRLDQTARRVRRRGEEVLLLRGVCTERVADIDLTIRRGEILGLAGTMGAGKTELLHAIAGLDRLIAGEIELGGYPVRMDSAARAVRYGVFLVPEDRKMEGLVFGMSIAENITLPYLRSLARGPFVSRAAQRRVAAELAERLGIRTPSVGQQVGKLSGGNQQKTVLARWLSMAPRVLLLDQPTRGLDIGAKEELYTLIQELAASGVAVIFVATELPELGRVCDRVAVMRDRTVVHVFEGSISEQELLLAAAGAA
jgi:ABC-type sugar transport system ATPase subunit